GLLDKTISFHWFSKKDEGVSPWANKNGTVENINKKRALAINLKMDKQTLIKRPRIYSKHFTVPGNLTHGDDTVPTQSVDKSGNPINKKFHILRIIDDIGLKYLKLEILQFKCLQAKLKIPFTTILETKAKLITMTGIF
ncbi:Hypothetical protein CINCED_3A013563, partial [Cinara cedri]